MESYSHFFLICHFDLILSASKTLLDFRDTFSWFTSSIIVKACTELYFCTSISPIGAGILVGQLAQHWFRMAASGKQSTWFPLEWLVEMSSTCTHLLVNLVWTYIDYKIIFRCSRKMSDFDIGLLVVCLHFVNVTRL